MQAESTSLDILGSFDQRLALAESLEDLGQLARDTLALRDVARTALKNRAFTNRATVAYAKVARKAGGMLAEVPRSGGPGRGKKNRHGGGSFTQACDEAGIATRTADRWQELAKIGSDRFEQWCRAAENDEIEPVIGSLLASTAHLSSEKDEWATPDDLYGALDDEFHFTLDVCASAQNAKGKRFFTKEIDGLNQSWEGDIAFMNPPYSDIENWMSKAAAEGEITTVVCVVPARTDVGWFWNYAQLGEVRFLRGRQHFIDDEGNTGPAPFPSCVIIFGPAIEPSMFCWAWKEDDSP
jgi:phage N-6-adenine-methyltransferase